VLHAFPSCSTLHYASYKVRTKDDALITVKVMMFFELRDIETMVCILFHDDELNVIRFNITVEPDN